MTHKNNDKQPADLKKYNAMDPLHIVEAPSTFQSCERRQCMLLMIVMITLRDDYIIFIIIFQMSLRGYLISLIKN